MRHSLATIKSAFLTGVLAAIFLMAATAVCARPLPNRQRMLEKIETIKMWKMMDALNLDSQTALKVFPIVKEIDRKRLNLRLKQRTLLKKIEALIKDGRVNAQNLNPLANQFFSLNEQISQLQKEEYQKLKTYLTDTQLAKLLLFQKRFRRELIRRWMKGRHDHKQGMPFGHPKLPMNHPPQN